MRELLFQIMLWAYPGMAILYGLWAMLYFGGRNTLSSQVERGMGIPVWINGVHFALHSAAFYTLYFATKDLPINNNSLAFTIRSLWAGAFVCAVVITVIYYVRMMIGTWRIGKGGS